MHTEHRTYLEYLTVDSATPNSKAVECADIISAGVSLIVPRICARIPEELFISARCRLYQIFPYCPRHSAEGRVLWSVVLRRIAGHFRQWICDIVYSYRIYFDGCSARDQYLLHKCCRSALRRCDHRDIYMATCRFLEDRGKPQNDMMIIKIDKFMSHNPSNWWLCCNNPRAGSRTMINWHWPQQLRTIGIPDSEWSARLNTHTHTQLSESAERIRIRIFYSCSSRRLSICD